MNWKSRRNARRVRKQRPRRYQFSRTKKLRGWVLKMAMEIWYCEYKRSDNPAFEPWTGPTGLEDVTR